MSSSSSRKPRRFLITGTDTEVGKTWFGSRLVAQARARGLRVGVMKPAETGCPAREGRLYPQDATELLREAGAPLPIEIVCPYTYRSPLAPSIAAELDRLPMPSLERIRRCFEQVAHNADLVVVEGAGGLAVPLTWELNYADLAAALELEVVVVVGNRLGCLNVAVLTVDYLRRRNLGFCGCVLNDTAAPATPAEFSNAASLEKLIGEKFLGHIPFRGPLPRALVDQLLEPR